MGHDSFHYFIIAIMILIFFRQKPCLIYFIFFIDAYGQ